MSAPQFSVIVPVYNGARYLGACLDSLLGQTLTDWECIVVDDGSTDGTPAVIAEVAARDPRVRGVAQAQRGVSVARNHGARLARGGWLAFLDSDDYYYPDALATFAAAAAHAREARIVCALVDSERPPLDPALCTGAIAVSDALATTYGISSLGPRVLLQTAAFARTLLDEVGGFDEELRTGEDRHFLIRATARSPVALFGRCVAWYRREPGGGKSDRYIATGEKLVAAQRIFTTIGPRIEAHLSPSARASYPRWRTAFLAMLDCGLELRAERIPAAAAALCRMAGACVTADELTTLVTKLVYFLYYPYWIPDEADARCHAWFAPLAAELAAGAAPSALRDEVARHARQFARADAGAGAAAGVA